jgi:putative MATE family efflux protein
MAQPREVRRTGVDVFDESRPMWQTFLVFLVPLMIANILQSLSQTFSYIFLGRLLGVQALAAVSAVFPVVFLLFSFLIGIASGSTVLIGQAFGARDEHRVKKVAGTVLGATMTFAAFVMVAGYVVSPWMLKALGTPASILAQSEAYTRVIFLTAPVLFPYLVYTTFLRGVGDSQTPLWFLVLGTLLGILFTPMFIQGWLGLPQLGVVSAAVSQLLSNSISFAALLAVLARRRHPLRFDAEMARDMIFDTRIMWRVIRIGVPTGIQVIMVSLAEIAVISFVNRFGAAATAAYGAVNQIVSYVQFPAMSIGIAASIFGAQCIGARRTDKLGSVIRSAAGLNYAIGGVLIVLCYVFSREVLGLFITDQTTLDVARGLLFITLWSYLLFGNMAVLSGVMRSSGTVLVPTLIGVCGIWLVEVPSAYLLMRHLGLRGIWMGYPLYYAAALCAQFLYYELSWKKKTHERLV